MPRLAGQVLRERQVSREEILTGETEGPEGLPSLVPRMEASPSVGHNLELIRRHPRQIMLLLAGMGAPVALAPVVASLFRPRFLTGAAFWICAEAMG